jgi:hypothetical protein
VAVGAELGQLGDAIDELGDLGAELLLDVSEAEFGVLRNVMEEGGLDRDRVDAELGQDLGRSDRVGDERLPGTSNARPTGSRSAPGCSSRIAA